MKEITNWNECPINIAYSIYDIIIDQESTPIQKNIKLISLIYEIPEDKVYSMPLDEYNQYVSKLNWMNTSIPFNPNYSAKSININGQKYIVTPIDKLSIGQYIDFQTFWQKHDEKKYIGNILASFLVPEGKKYGEDYDILALANLFRENLSIVVGRNLTFFFLKEYLDLMVSSFIYSRKMMKTKEEREQVTMTLNTILDGLV